MKTIFTTITAILLATSAYAQELQSARGNECKAVYSQSLAQATKVGWNTKEITDPVKKANLIKVYNSVPPSGDIDVDHVAVSILGDQEEAYVILHDDPDCLVGVLLLNLDQLVQGAKTGHIDQTGNE